ncbi:receptor-like protein kinase [Gossypium australe]|uniref:Receptor-like protein kinase n=1 Tax=Gossypium australe TaxID=47621 RepID=A0A5B6V0Y3_9ROSI|nr:receptor-like protein kinase [Gossypium australe]
MGPIAYQLDPIHDVFHVCILRRYRSDPFHVVSVEKIKVLSKKSILFVKVLWQNHGTEEATWEPEDSIRQ